MKAAIAFCSLLLLFLIACKIPREKVWSKCHPSLITIQPIGEVDSDLANQLRNRLSRTGSILVELLPAIEAPDFGYNRTKRRYIADSVLHYLKRNKSEQAEKLIGLMSVDIETSKAGQKSWGVMGLGECPGNVCVVSYFRVRRTSKNQKQLLDRMTVLCLHELGHCFSLPHCKNKDCLMQDAKGKMTLDVANSFCTKCKTLLMENGFVTADSTNNRGLFTTH
jgi:archaemetzincin